MLHFGILFLLGIFQFRPVFKKIAHESMSCEAFSLFVPFMAQLFVDILDDFIHVVDDVFRWLFKSTSLAFVIFGAIILLVGYHEEIIIPAMNGFLVEVITMIYFVAVIVIIRYIQRNIGIKCIFSVKMMSHDFNVIFKSY